MTDSIPFGTGIICTPEEYTRSLTDASITCLTRGQSISLVLAIETGMLSLFSVVGVFTYIYVNFYRSTQGSKLAIWRIVQDPVDIFMLSLFFSDILQALGAVLDIKWVHDGKVVVGALCTAQGIIQQLGETSVAMTTLVIAMHTFIGVWFRKGLRSLIGARIIMGLLWLFVILSVAVPNIIHRHQYELYEAPGPYWCWIGHNYLGFKIWGEYIWLWLTLLLSFLTYIPLCIRSRELRINSLIMIAYPAVYSVLVLPISVVRWIEFVNPNGVSATAPIIVVCFFGLSGAFNVLLFSLTRPDSYLFRSRPVSSYYGQAPLLNSNDGRDVNAEAQGGGNGQALGRLPSLSGASRHSNGNTDTTPNGVTQEV